MCVYVAGEMGTVRFIGHVQFADGVWLGIELKKPGVFLFLNRPKTIVNPHSKVYILQDE